MDVQRLLDPEIAIALSGRTANFGGLTLDDIPALRAERAAARVTVPLSVVVERTDHSIPGGAGGPNVTVRVHRPAHRTGPLSRVC